MYSSFRPNKKCNYNYFSSKVPGSNRNYHRIHQAAWLGLVRSYGKCAEIITGGESQDKGHKTVNKILMSKNCHKQEWRGISTGKVGTQS